MSLRLDIGGVKNGLKSLGAFEKVGIAAALVVTKDDKRAAGLYVRGSDFGSSAACRNAGSSSRAAQA